MAWAPPEASLALAAVPVTPEDVQKGLSRENWRILLADRVAWMAKQEPDPLVAIDRLAAELEARDLWPGVAFVAETPDGRVSELLTQNPLWPDYLNLQVDLPEDDPMPVRPVPAAVRAVQETTLAEWLDLFLT
jgi:hypothetical protein